MSLPRRMNPEHVLQATLMKFWAINGRDDLMMFAIANGDLRNIAVAMRLKKEGVMRGVPDLCCTLDQGRTGWIELKAKGGSMTDEQKAFAAKVQKLGHHWALCRSLDEAAHVLQEWGALKRRVVWHPE